MIGLYESHITPPRLTTVGFLDGGFQMIHSACNQMCLLIQNQEIGYPKILPHRAFFLPTLTVRASSKKLTSSRKVQPKKPAPSLAKISSLESWTKTYPSLNQGSDYWSQINLSKFANHSMSKNHGWLGSHPLLHFPPGTHSIHGVPFEVLDPGCNEGRTVITFRSPHSHSTGGDELPTSIQLPIGQCVNAIYFLHGCGWTRYQEPFAEYVIHYTNGKNATIPLIPSGIPRKSTTRRATSFNPNIEDWWPNREPRDYSHALYAKVSNPLAPQVYDCKLYTLEWINPRPKDEVSKIEVRIDPKAGPALALIAVTALIGNGEP